MILTITMTAAFGIYAALYFLVLKLRPHWNSWKLWLASCLAPAVTSVVIGLLAAATEPAVGLAYDELNDTGEARRTFAILLVFALIVPLAYLAISTAMHLVVRMLGNKA
jgi:hypothetical protein